MATSPIPAYCSTCGVIFAVNLFRVEGSGTISLTLSGNVTTCINCGSTANIADGVFELTSEAIKLLAGPQLTSELLRVFYRTVKRGLEEKKSVEDIQSDLNNADKNFTGVLYQAALIRTHAPIYVARWT